MISIFPAEMAAGAKVASPLMPKIWYLAPHRFNTLPQDMLVKEYDGVKRLVLRGRGNPLIITFWKL